MLDESSMPASKSIWMDGFWLRGAAYRTTDTGAAEQ
jgi:hypothetical protein